MIERPSPRIALASLVAVFAMTFVTTHFSWWLFSQDYLESVEDSVLVFAILAAFQLSYLIALSGIVVFCVWHYPIWVGIVSAFGVATATIAPQACMFLFADERRGNILAWVSETGAATFGITLTSYVIALVLKPIAPSLENEDRRPTWRFAVAEILALTTAVAATATLSGAGETFGVTTIVQTIVRTLAVAAAIYALYARNLAAAVIVSFIAWIGYLYYELSLVDMMWETFSVAWISVAVAWFLAPLALRWLANSWPQRVE